MKLYDRFLLRAKEGHFVNESVELARQLADYIKKNPKKKFAFLVMDKSGRP